jgi:hypothetical protein
MATQGEKYQALSEFFKGSFRPKELEIFLTMDGWAEGNPAVEPRRSGFQPDAGKSQAGSLTYRPAGLAQSRPARAEPLPWAPYGASELLYSA